MNDEEVQSRVPRRKDEPMIQFEARSDGDEFDVRLHGRWRSLIVCIGRLTALLGALTGLLLAVGELGRAAGLLIADSQ